MTNSTEFPRGFPRKLEGVVGKQAGNTERKPGRVREETLVQAKSGASTLDSCPLPVYRWRFATYERVPVPRCAMAANEKYDHVVVGILLGKRSPRANSSFGRCLCCLRPSTHALEPCQCAVREAAYTHTCRACVLTPAIVHCGREFFLRRSQSTAAAACLPRNPAALLARAPTTAAA